MKKPKKQINRFTRVLIPAILCLVAVISARSSEPTCNGKPLSAWLLILKTGHTSAGEPVKEADAQEAIRQIGTNGIHTLIDLLGVKDENVKKVLSNIHDKNLTFYYKCDENTIASQESLRKLGVDGFAILGTNAECAVPQIAKVFDEHDNETAFQAARALSKVGPKGFSVLTNAINDPDAGVRDVVLQVIGAEGSGDPQVIRQFFINALKDTNTFIRLDAAGFLRGKDPDLVIPVLIPLLDGSGHDAFAAARMLGACGPAAKNAAPKLLSMFTNIVVGPEERLAKSLGMDLMGALKAIDTDTAAKAEDFLVNSGPLNYARDGYTTTLLKNGKELIAGGSIHTEIPTVKNRYLSSAELFDPKTSKWIKTGEMSTPRVYHMAVLLPNGKVLVTGGIDGKGHDLTSAELYDPTTGQWTAMGWMHDSHWSERMALQTDGKVLVYEGGFDQYPVVGHELYDPATGAWTVIPKEQEHNRAWRPSPKQ